MLKVVWVYFHALIFLLASGIKLIYIVIKKLFMNRGKQNEETDIL